MNQQATDWVEEAYIISKNQACKTSVLFKKNCRFLLGNHNAKHS